MLNRLLGPPHDNETAAIRSPDEAGKRQFEGPIYDFFHSSNSFFRRSRWPDSPEYRRLDLRAPRLGRSCTPKSKAPPSSLFGLAVAARGWDRTGQIDRRVFGGS